MLARHEKAVAIRVPSKKSLAAKAKRKAATAAKADEQLEKLSLADAIAVLRVGHSKSRLDGTHTNGSLLQAVEVASPNATYELFIKTEIKSGIAVPKGRVNLPREAKPKTEDKVLVFAEGREAEEAKNAGAHFVGGTELIDGVGPTTSMFGARLNSCSPFPSGYQQSL